MTSSIELTTHQDLVSIPVDIHAHLALLVPCLAFVSSNRIVAWIYAPVTSNAHPAKPKGDLIHVLLAIHLDSDMRTDDSLVVKLPFTSAESVGRPTFGPASLKLGALTNSAPSQHTADNKLEACRRTYLWMCLKAEKLTRSCSLWMPFRPVHGELTAEKKDELDDKGQQRAVNIKQHEEVSNCLSVFL
ncbi:hypothetical protein BCR44DRAFT_1423651 [Catenaria anguillulae PL171]|uniref:Uncharacterized protein n=1 Tax=Catenaria anguillulae PL171 TaxID=765915 RepID=A0A1Y2I3B3_9FUNG|nr:hypothetical protein BCR44DRAFT_1423651 [Catenaria anguillulae PL171]